MAMNRLNVLLLDCHTAGSSKIKSLLTQQENTHFQIWHFSAHHQASRFLEDKSVNIDIIILDIFLIDPINPQEIYNLLSRSAESIPIVLVAGESQHALAVEITAKGAADVVIRERFETYPQRLFDAIEYSIIRGKQLVELRERCESALDHHKHLLHWMTNGYSVEVSTDITQQTKEVHAG